MQKKINITYINFHGDTNITSAYLHSLIDKSGFNIKTIHFRRLLTEFTPPTRAELNILKKVVDKINPHVILMSVNSISLWVAIESIKLFPDKLIIWGGVQPLIEPERCLQYVPIIVRGEGDGAIIDILKAIQNNHRTDNIKNVWIKKGDKIIKNDFRPLVQDLDCLPFPDYTNKNKIYIIGDKAFTKNPLPHLNYEYHASFSRGCPFSCTYCLNHLLNKLFNNKYLRRRSVKSAIKELILAKKIFPKLKFINFWDDVLITDKKWLREFLIQYKKYINLPFFAYGNANFVDEESMRLLKWAGISFFELGLQSGNENIRKKIFNRIDSDEKILRADNIIHKCKIPVGYDLIYSEFETEKTMEEGLHFMLNLKKPFKIGHHKLAYYTKFDITNLALSENKISLDQVAGINPTIRTQDITKEEARKDSIMNYHYFIGKNLIPNWFIIYMFNHRWHKKHAKLLTEVGEFINKDFKYAISNTLKLLINGEFKYVYNRIFNKKYYMPY